MTDPNPRTGAPDHDGRRDRGDRGAILPMVLVVSVVLSMVVVSVATYATSTLRFGAVVESRSDRLAAAEAAMQDALERLRIVDGLCTTGSGSGESVNPSFPAINGVDVDVTCRMFGTELPPSDGWAIVVTGLGPAVGGKTFITSAGGNPILEGPVYVHDPNAIDFRNTTIKNGSLWYTDYACAGGGPGDDLSFQDSSVAISNLTFDPNNRKVYCVNRTWDQLFDATPPTGHVGSIPVAPAPDTSGACNVHYPGRYNPGNPPVIGSHNYFRSGDYVFENLGQLELQHQRLTFGTIDPEDDPVYPLIELSSACEAARQADPSRDGATLYLTGSTRFRLQAQTHLEVSGRQHGDFIVAMQTVGSTVDTILTTGSGNNKESAFSGLVWAPNAKIEVGTVAAQKEAAFRGGIVIGSFEGTISAAPSGGFLIRVPTSQASVKLLLESEAVDDRGATTIRVVADYRPSRGDVAVNSWRVCATAGC